MQADKTARPVPHIIVSQDVGQDPPAIYCPVCGTLIIGKGEENTCGHVLFSYVDIADQFSTIAPAYREAIEKIMEEDDPSDWIERALELFREKESAFCITINCSGMGCGPVGFSVSAAFDFSPKEDTEEK